MCDLAFDFDVDYYINPFIPRSFLHLVPTPVSWLLGHRFKPRLPIGSVLVWFWAFVGAFAGILVVEAVFRIETEISPDACCHCEFGKHSQFLVLRISILTHLDLR
jgi:hypothetical protein